MRSVESWSNNRADKVAGRIGARTCHLIKMLTRNYIGSRFGFKIDGEPAANFSRFSVSSAGDLNGDGIDDLAITKTNDVGFVGANQPVTYFIDVVNVGAVEVLGSTVTDNLPVTLDAGTASWTCTGSGGAMCPNASGSGNINETIDLPVGGMLSFELTATVVATEGMTVTNTASVSLPAGHSDINPADNSASDSDPVSLFADGFEDS